MIEDLNIDFYDLEIYEGRRKSGGEFARIDNKHFSMRINVEICRKIPIEYKFLNLAISKDRNFIILILKVHGNDFSMKITRTDKGCNFSLRSFIKFYNLKNRDIFNKHLKTTFKDTADGGKCLVIHLDK